MKFYTPILSTVEQAVQDALLKVGKETLERSNNAAPKDSGDLVKSGAVRADDLTVQVSYAQRHALFQHENLDYQHAGGGKAKFLEDAALEVDVEQIVAASVRAALGG